MTAPGSPVFETMSRDECFERLETVPVGRIGLSIGALPQVLPVNFVVHEDAIVVRTLRGTKLDAAAAGAVVAFEVDHYEDDGSSGWSVMLQGEASEITDQSALDVARSLPLRPWAMGDKADRFVQIETLRMTGRKFTWPSQLRVETQDTAT